jgi:integrase
MQFDNFVNTFFTVCAQRKNSAGEMAQKRMALTNHLLPYFGKMAMESIGAKEIREYVMGKLADGYADKTVNNHLLVLSRYLAVARDERVLDAPKVKIESIPVTWSEARYLDASEIRRLVMAAGHDSPEYANLITVALNTGMRIGELLALSWADIDLEAKKIRVRKSLCRVSGTLKTPKNGKQRDIFLNEAAIAALRSLEHRVGTVFSVSYSAAYDAITRISAKAGLDGVGWHTLRHTFASLLVLEGVPLFTVSRLLGHSSIRITERYTHLNDEKNKDAVASLAVAMGA